MLRLTLEDEGYRVETAADAEAGLALLRRGPLPVLILLDLAMPGGIDGWGFRAVQLGMAGARDVPVVVLSANRNLLPPSAELAPDAVVPKPFDLDHLVATVKELDPLRAAEMSAADAEPDILPSHADPSLGTQPA